MSGLAKLFLALWCLGFSLWALSFVGWERFLARLRGSEPEPITNECAPGCPLCDVQNRIEQHYHDCALCQADGECAAMASLWEEQERATDELFPDTEFTTNASNTITYIELPQRWWHWPRRTR